MSATTDESARPCVLADSTIRRLPSSRLIWFGPSLSSISANKDSGTLPPDHVFTCGRLYASTVVEAVGTLNKLLHFYPKGGEDEMRYYISIGDAIETLGYCVSACVEGSDKHLAAEIAGALMGATAHASASTTTSFARGKRV